MTVSSSKIIRWFLSSFILLSFTVLLNYLRASSSGESFLAYYLASSFKVVGLSIACTIAFIVFKKWRSAFAQSGAIKNWNLETDITYKLKKARWRFFIKGRNLLNLVPVKQIDTHFTQTDIEEITYQSFPGYLLLGVSKEFWFS